MRRRRHFKAEKGSKWTKFASPKRRPEGSESNLQTSYENARKRDRFVSVRVHTCMGPLPVSAHRRDAAGKSTTVPTPLLLLAPPLVIAVASAAGDV
jgi:hypothetical protein